MGAECCVAGSPQTLGRIARTDSCGAVASRIATQGTLNGCRCPAGLGWFSWQSRVWNDEYNKNTVGFEEGESMYPAYCFHSFGSEEWLEQVFVGMWFADPHKGRWEEIIRPAIRDAGGENRVARPPGLLLEG